MKNVTNTKTSPSPKSREKNLGQCLYLDELSGSYFFMKEFGKGPTRKKIREKLVATSIREARKEVLARIDAATHRVTKKEATAKTFDDLVGLWVQSKTHLRPRAFETIGFTAKALLNHFAGTPINLLTSTKCLTWASARRQEQVRNTGRTVSSSQFNKEFDALKAVCELGVKLGVLYTNPMDQGLVSKMKPNAEAITIPSREQFQKIVGALEEIGHENAVLLTKLLAFSGARLSEATSLTWADVGIHQLETQTTFRILNAKRRKGDTQYREIPIFPRLRELLREEKLKRNPEETDRVSPIRDARTSYSRIEAEVGFHVHHHMFRHFFASNAIEAGVDFKTIAHWLNHNDGGVLVARTYGHLRQDHSIAMAQRM
jgi:integrase